MSELDVKLVSPSTITRDDQIYLQYLAEIARPLETCGVIHRDGRIVEYNNTFDGDRKLGFDMEIDIHDDSIVAIWHSHPGGLSRPSQDDLPCIKLLLEHGFHFHHVIVTPIVVVEFEAVLFDLTA
jgi:proteasome lid subunit RPN8/RPN11